MKYHFQSHHFYTAYWSAVHYQPHHFCTTYRSVVNFQSYYFERSFVCITSRLINEPSPWKRQYFQFKKIPLTYFQAFCFQIISFIDFSRCLLQDTNFGYPLQNEPCYGQNPLNLYRCVTF